MMIIHNFLIHIARFPVIGGKHFNSEEAADLATYFDVGGIVGKTIL